MSPYRAPGMDIQFLIDPYPRLDQASFAVGGVAIDGTVN
jgi:hypothetical protein